MNWLIGLIACLLAGILWLLFEIHHQLFELKRLTAMKALREEERANRSFD